MASWKWMKQWLHLGSHRWSRERRNISREFSNFLCNLKKSRVIGLKNCRMIHDVIECTLGKKEEGVLRSDYLRLRFPESHNPINSLSLAKACYKIIVTSWLRVITKANKKVTQKIHHWAHTHISPGRHLRQSRQVKKNGLGGKWEFPKELVKVESVR